MTLRLTQSRSTDTVFMMKHNFSTHARSANPPNSDEVIAEANFCVDKIQKMAHEDATARRCPTGDTY
jgi:hypothetical protein